MLLCMLCCLGCCQMLLCMLCCLGCCRQRLHGGSSAATQDFKGCQKGGMGLPKHQGLAEADQQMQHVQQSFTGKGDGFTLL